MAEAELVRRKCGYCYRSYVVTFGTDGNGNVVETSECPCTARRIRGLCMDCPAPVEGKIGLALRCAECKKAVERKRQQRWRRNNPRKVRAAWRRHSEKRRTDPELRARIRAREREYRSRPEVAARIREQNRRRRVLRPELKRAEHARYKAKHPDRVAESQRKTNARPERIKARREWSHLYGTKYVGEGCEGPKCRTCGGDVPYDGRGRPHAECPECNPGSWTPESLTRNTAGYIQETR